MRTNGTRTIGSVQSIAPFDDGALGLGSTGAAEELGVAAVDTTGGAGGGVQVFRSGWPATGVGGATDWRAPGAGWSAGRRARQACRPGGRRPAVVPSVSSC